LEAADLPPETEAVPAPQPAPRARARVIRIRRADPPPAAPASALSDEAEAALQAELAALEAEIEGIDAGDSLAETPAETAAEDQAETAVAPTAEPPLGARQKIKEQTEDESVNRLMDHAKSEMDGSETRRRQSAIAHLKAAVAATVADRKLGGEGSDTASARMDAYRSDLDRVVRPRRPVAESSTPRPAPVADAAPRPTPLVLVSAQRIDRAQTASPEAAETPRVVMPVRPRRVSPPGAETAQPSAPLMQNSDQIAQENDPFDADESLADDDTDNVFGDATSFQDFADQLGASALPDLLEAAAVYCAEVLNRPEFSRPLVMRQIAGLPGQTATAREDYLRGFGTLLRQGRIAKVKRGMFALTDRSPYLAEARKQVG